MRIALIGVAAVATLAMGCGNSNNNVGKPAGETTTPSATSPTSPGAGTQPPSSQPGSPSGTPSQSSGPVKCRTADLSGELRSDGAAAGNVYATLILTNNSNRDCTIRGYGGLQLMDAQHKTIVTHQERDPNHPAKLVTLKPKDKASAVLHYGDVPAGNEPVDKQCEPTPAFLNVIPPDETIALSIKWDSGPVCQQGRIEQWAYAPGIVSP